MGKECVEGKRGDGKSVEGVGEFVFKMKEVLVGLDRGWIE